MNFNYEEEIYFEKDKKFFLRNKNKKKNKEKKNRYMDIVKKLKSVKSTPNIAINKELLFSYIE